MMNPTRLLFYLLSAVLFIIPAMHTSQDQPLNTRLQLENVRQFLLSNDQNRVLVVNTDGDLVIHDIRSGAILLTIETAPFNAQLNDLSWSSDDMLIGGAFSDRARIWNSHTGILVADLQDYPRQPVFEDASSDVHGIVFSPTEPIYVIYNINDTSVLVYDLTTQEIKYELDTSPNTFIWDITFSPNGAYLSIAPGSVWDMRTGQKIYQLEGVTMAFSPDSTRIASSNGWRVSQIAVWDLSNGERLHQVSTLLNTSNLEWSTDGQALYGLFGSGMLSHDHWVYNGYGIKSWGLSNINLERIFGIPETIRLPITLPDDMAISWLGIISREGTLSIWDGETEDFIYHELSADTPEQEYTVFTQDIFTFDIHHKRGLIAGGHENGIRLWHIASGEYVDLLPDTPIYQLEFLDDGNELIIRTSQNELIVLTLKN